MGEQQLPVWLRDPDWLRSMRQRRRARLAVRHPRVHAWVGAVEDRFARLVDRVVPLRRVDGLAALMASMIVLDSSATGLYLRRGLAVEGNPWVVAMMDTYGDGVGLAVRAAWSLAVLLVIRIGAVRDRRFRGVMLVAAAGLSLITTVHLAALGWIVLTSPG